MARSAFKIQDKFESSAHIRFIEQFRIQTISFKDNLKPESLDDVTFSSKAGYWPKMPMIISGDGSPWELGNAYLLARLEKCQPWEMATLQDIANGLLTYLRFCEDNEIDPLNIPRKDSKKPTYRYVMKIKEFMEEGFPRSTASKLVSQMTNFYKNLEALNLIDEAKLGREPFKRLVRHIKTHDSFGFAKQLKVETTDLAITVPRSAPAHGRLADGGQLRPLSQEEIAALMDALYLGRHKPNGQAPHSDEESLCTTQLARMIEVALCTGARRQTVCTLRVGHIKELYSRIKDGSHSVRLHTNAARNETGIKIDTKYNKDGVLVFPVSLVKRLYNHVTSQAHKDNMAKHEHYGLSDRNYAFLTNRGAPYITSKAEIRERQDIESHYSVNAPNFLIQKGDALTMLLKNFLTRLIEKYPQAKPFVFHDLRATCGMMIVRNMVSRGYKEAQIRAHVQQMLWHTDPTTTEAYLNYDEFLAQDIKITDLIEESILDGMIDIDDVYGAAV